MKHYDVWCRQVSVQDQSQSTWVCSLSTCGWQLLLSWSSSQSSSSSTNKRSVISNKRTVSIVLYCGIARFALLLHAACYTCVTLHLNKEHFSFMVCQSCSTRVLDLDFSRTRVHVLADLDLDLNSRTLWPSLKRLPTSQVRQNMNSSPTEVQVQDSSTTTMTDDKRKMLFIQMYLTMSHRSRHQSCLPAMTVLKVSKHPQRHSTAHTLPQLVPSAAVQWWLTWMLEQTPEITEPAVPLAMSVLPVPATSAPVECVFSHGRCRCRWRSSDCS